jgi:hypothetical protein
VSSGDVGALTDGLPVNRTGGCGVVDKMVRWPSQAIDGKEKQCCKCQKGRDWGVHTHHDFGGAERQSISYISAWSERR